MGGYGVLKGKRKRKKKNKKREKYNTRKDG